MATIRLQINDKVLDKVLKILGHFSHDEVEIISEDEDFLEQKEFVANELQKMDNGEVEFITVDQMNQQARELLAKYEA